MSGPINVGDRVTFRVDHWQTSWAPVVLPYGWNLSDGPFEGVVREVMPVSYGGAILLVDWGTNGLHTMHQSWVDVNTELVIKVN